MDEIENKPFSTPALDSPDLREEIESLRHLLGSILILLVVVSGTLTIFLLREMKNTSAQLEAFHPILFKWGLKTTSPTLPGAPAASVPPPSNAVPKKEGSRLVRSRTQLG